MPESWPDLLRPLATAEPPLDLAQRVREREVALVGRGRRVWSLPRGVTWALAGFGCCLVLGALALAAHSRRAPEAGSEAWPVASPVKLAILRSSFAPQQFFRRVPSVVEAQSRVPFPVPLPAASVGDVDSVMVGSHPPQIIVLWKSGVIETIEPWSCRCMPAASLRKMARELPPESYRAIGGWPALYAPSDTSPKNLMGIVSKAVEAYGEPASVEVVQHGLNVRLYAYGDHVLPPLLSVARTLHVAGFTGVSGQVMHSGGTATAQGGNDRPVRHAMVALTGTTAAGRQLSRTVQTTGGGAFWARLPAGHYHASWSGVASTFNVHPNTVSDVMVQVISP